MHGYRTGIGPGAFGYLRRRAAGGGAAEPAAGTPAITAFTPGPSVAGSGGRGWSFIATAAAEVTGLRVYGYTEGTAYPPGDRARLWRYTDGALLAEVIVIPEHLQWVTGALATPVPLEVNAEYVLSVDNSGGSGVTCTFTRFTGSEQTFAPGIAFRNGLYGGTDTAPPRTTYTTAAAVDAMLAT